MREIVRVTPLRRAPERWGRVAMTTVGIGCFDVCRHLVFFFQAEDGIRDLTVTGVQTCALPIYFFIFVFCLKAISGEFHTGVKSVAEGIFLTLAFRPLGALVFGWLAEKHGRRPILMLNVASYSAMQLATAFAPNLATLLALRALFGLDRKSTRLNSSHSQISYAVFCLKKKKTSDTLPAVIH